MAELYSYEAERKVLGALCDRPKLRGFILNRLDPQMFGSEAGAAVFKRIQTLIGLGKKIPGCTVMADDPGINPGLRSILIHDETEAKQIYNLRRSDIEHSLDLLRFYHQKRTFYEMQKWCAEKLSSSELPDMPELRAEMMRRLGDSETFDEVSTHSRTIGKDTNIDRQYLIDRLSADRNQIIRTGMPAIDGRATLTRGNMVLLTAKRGQGKSLLAKSLGVQHYNQKQSVYIVNLEMEEWEYFARIFAEVTRYSHDDIREGFPTRQVFEQQEKPDGTLFDQPLYSRKQIKRGREHATNVIKQAEQMSSFGEKHNCRYTVRTVSNPNYTPALLHNELKYQRYDVVIIDYINLFKMVHKDLWQSLYAHTKYLKMLAKDCGVLLYVLAQLTEEGRAKYARAAEEDADAWWHWEINPGNPKVKFFHGKARHYRPFSFELIFDGKSTCFKDPGEVDDKELRVLERDAEEHAAEIMKHMEAVEADRLRSQTKTKKPERGHAR